MVVYNDDTIDIQVCCVQKSYLRLGGTTILQYLFYLFRIILQDLVWGDHNTLIPYLGILVNILITTSQLVRFGMLMGCYKKAM
jgi:hypothetical protein